MEKDRERGFLIQEGPQGVIALLFPSDQRLESTEVIKDGTPSDPPSGTLKSSGQVSLSDSLDIGWIPIQE